MQSYAFSRCCHFLRKQSEKMVFSKFTQSILKIMIDFSFEEIHPAEDEKEEQKSYYSFRLELQLSAFVLCKYTSKI